MATQKKLTHTEGMSFLTALIELVYNLVKSLKKNKTTEANNL